MQIKDFTEAHIENALQIAKINCENERAFVPELPDVDKTLDLTEFAKNGLGVAAFEGDEMVGFLCCVSPFKNVFRSTEATGVFSPMSANGAIGKNRASVFARMYQAAGEKWAKAGASSHAVCLYAHDREANEQFFRYGFGIRTVDAIRELHQIDAPNCEEYFFSLLAKEEKTKILPLQNLLNESYLNSPFFMYRENGNDVSYELCFVAEYENKTVAFIKAETDGENFIVNTPGYLHVNGAFCQPEHRGKGLHQKLLNLLSAEIKKRGYARLGVD
ncbi:MAG: GNAT family N-acetyltransferase, partial [Clostridiales bacterium]|nr:GNAT family N-acetyltransferase [Clostridiales bacterium]